MNILQSTIPMCNPYFVDGFQTGDYYNYNYSHKNNNETATYKMVTKDEFEEMTADKEFQTNGHKDYQYSPKDTETEDLLKQPHFEMEHHAFKLDIFNLSRQPGGNHPDIERVMKDTLKMRNENKDLFADKNSSFIILDKKGDKKDQIIAFARHNNGRTAIVIANKNPNRRMTGTVVIPGLKESQVLKNLAPKYGEETSKFQIVSNELRVNLSPAGAYVFEIDTPNIENDMTGKVYKQKTTD